MKRKKKSFISVVSEIVMCILVTCLFTILIPTMNVRAEGEMISLSRIGTSQRGYYADPDGYCLYCVNEMKRCAYNGGEIYTKSIGGGYEMYDGIFGVVQEALSEGVLDGETIRIIAQWAIWSKGSSDYFESAKYYYGNNGAELFNRMMNADPGTYDVTYIIYTPSDDCYQTCAGAYSVSKIETHTHSWDEGTVTREATYDSEGEITYTCTGCDETRTETIPMLVCSSHCWDNGTVTTSPTYQSTGVRTYTCVNCGETRTETIPMLVCSSHCWDNGIVTTAATYHSAGVRTYTCTNCGETRTETIPLLICTDHHWDNGKVTAAATYHSAGVRTYTCTNCGQTRTETIPQLICTEHSWDNGTVTTAATYHSAGVRTYTCRNCGETRTETIPKLVCTEHAYGNAILTSAGNGVYYYISECTRCGEMHSTLHEHEFKWVTINPATEEEAGTERYLCEECGYYTLEREVPRIRAQACTHPYPRDFVETVPATCCSHPRGQIICRECGEIVINDYEYERLGYNPDNHTHFTATVRVEPTYEFNGVMRYTCDGCGYYYTKPIPQLVCSHDGRRISKWFGDERWAICATCGEKLYQLSTVVSTCNHIGTKKTQVLIKAPTATEWGEAAIVCECGRTVSTEQLHPYSEYQVTKPDGSTFTVYGWFDYEWAHEIADLTNTYRLENGLNALTYNESLQSASDTRVLETIASFSHTRPNGTRWTTTVPEWTYGGENLASGCTTPASAMNAWMESVSHNANLLYGIKSGQSSFRGISVGVFHRYIFNNSSKPYTPSEYIYWTQEFTFY